MLHTLAGRSLLGHVLVAARSLDPALLAVVVRHERDRVAEHAVSVDPDAVVVDQDEIPGTAAPCSARSPLSTRRRTRSRSSTACPTARRGAASATASRGPVVVTAGDTPLLDGGTLAQLLAAHVADGNAVTMLTTQLEDATGYGRVVRDDATGDVLRIVEHKDASPDELAIREINASIYVFDAAVLRRGLGTLGRDNAQGEVYLTDVVAAARAEGGVVRALVSDDPTVVEGVNDRVQLATLRAELNRRILEDWMRAGVTVVDPATTWVDVDVELARDVTLLPGTQLHGATVVAEGATVGPDTTLTDTEVGAGATVTRTHGSLAVLGAGRPSARSRTCGPAPCWGARQDRDVRRDEERGDRRGVEDPAPVLRGRRDDRRAHEHRCRVGHGQLRRRAQAPHRHRLARPHRSGQHVRRARERR